MKIFDKKYALFFLIFSTACTTTRTANQSSVADYDATGHAKVLMAAYQQKAAEYRALCYQAYNIAHLRLDQFVSESSPKPMAIMTDIDETVLDNSPYQVHQSLQGKDYDPTSWYEWTSRADADTLPGALNFFKYAASKNIEIFYVSNRDQIERKSTLENLKKFGFPFADDAHLKLKSTTSSKQARRDSIQMNYTLIMQVGDNLNDLNAAFEKKSIEKRFDVTNNFSADFGNRLIILPNPSYGDWENALYNYKYTLTPAQKDSVYRTILKNY